MLTSKQRAYLRGIASTYETIYQIGKGGVTEAMCKDIAEALRKRELIKLRVLENSGWTAREAADAVAEQTGHRFKVRAFQAQRERPCYRESPKG